MNMCKVGLSLQSFFKLRCFSMLAFGFNLSPAIVGQAIVFSMITRLAGGFLPAVRTSRLKIIETLRTEWSSFLEWRELAAG